MMDASEEFIIEVGNCNLFNFLASKLRNLKFSICLRLLIITGVLE